MPVERTLPQVGEQGQDARQPHVVLGITSPQTCLVLAGRLRAMRRAGFRVTLISSPGELLDETCAVEGVTGIAVPMERKIAPFQDLRALWTLWRLLRRLKPDLVEFSTPKAGLLGTMAARLARVPSRIYLLRGLKLEGARGWRQRVLVWAERIAAFCADTVLCTSRSLRREALEWKLAPATKLLVLGDGSSNGVNVEQFMPGPDEMRARLMLAAHAPVLGFVGRLTRDKGLPELLEAFEELVKRRPDLRLLLVGWFDQADDALDLATRERIERNPRVVCTGFVQDTAPFYRSMDILVLPTWREGFPNVVLEASASAIPVITTVSTGARDAVVPEVTGLLVPPGYPEAICEAVEKLLSDPARCVQMGEAGRKWVVEHFLDRRVLELTTSLYQDRIRSASGIVYPAIAGPEAR